MEKKQNQTKEIHIKKYTYRIEFLGTTLKHVFTAYRYLSQGD